MSRSKRRRKREARRRRAGRERGASGSLIHYTRGFQCRHTKRQKKRTTAKAGTCLWDEDVSVKGVIKVSGGTRTTDGQDGPWLRRLTGGRGREGGRVVMGRKGGRIGIVVGRREVLRQGERVDKGGKERN